MAVHTFTIVVDREPTNDELDTLFERADDVTFGFEDGVAVAVFDREATTLADAIASAVRHIESVGFSALRVLDEDLLTLGDIADRIGRSREAVRRYATGERGAGGFPPPINPIREGTLFYRWSEVAPWLRARLQVEAPDANPVLVVANLVLQARQHRHQVEHLSALTDLLGTDAAA
jgi:hypothetical protein